MRTAAILLLLTLSVSPALAIGLCEAAIASAERASGVPDRLMQAIGVMESGRRDASGQAAPWPWTINVEGAGYVFDSKAEAIAAVQAHQARGARSIDVGCMQVNLMHHASAFASLDEAFDPAANARYAANFLLRLLGQTGSWPRAAAGYHSLTPDIGGEYARKVLAIWAKPGLGQARTAAAAPPRPEPSPSVTPPVAAVSASLSMPGSATARILPIAGAAPSGATGRGLESYRASPTRLAAGGVLPRG